MTPSRTAEIAKKIAPCWGDGLAGPSKCDESFECELHYRIAKALESYGDQRAEEMRERAAKAHCAGCSKNYALETAENGTVLHRNEFGNLFDYCRSVIIRALPITPGTTEVE